MNDPTDPARKVVLVHKPRSRRVLGGDNQPFFVPNGVDLALEISLPDFAHVIEHHRGDPQVVPNSQVQGIDATLGSPIDNAVYDDTQFVQENELDPMRM